MILFFSTFFAFSAPFRRRLVAHTHLIGSHAETADIELWDL